jgi:hypothetical protein
VKENIVFSAARLAAAVSLMFVLGGVARADSLLTYLTTPPASNPGCWQAPPNSGLPCSQTAGITGAQLGTSVPSSNWTGYVANDPWSLASVDSAVTFSLSMTTSVNVNVDTFSFELFNNDCENNGFPIDGCNTRNWTIEESVDGSTFSPIYGPFNSGGPYADFTVNVPLGLSLSAGDTLALEAFSPDGASNDPGTGQYVFTNLSLSNSENTAVPEPSTLILLGPSIFGITNILRRRLRAGRMRQ